MKLYHGSNIVINHPDLTKGKPFKDFGQGFYLSDSIEQAMEMAERVAARVNVEQTPIVTTFEFDESVMTDGSLKVKSFETYTEEWAEFVLHNRDRKMPQPTHDYDIVYGPIADDGVVRQMRRFELGDITLKELMQELRYPPKITFQYFFGSKKALEKLIFIC
ncbi:MAG: DUF3990 domain-containing protein [Bacteroidales bacterium]|nr:DUF3990 domain-containing protein [Candidatus Scybalocola fimicaballi]